MIALALLFLGLRAWVRVIRRQHPNLSDFFVLLAWFGYCVNSITYTLMSKLQFELSSSKQNTVDVNANPDKIVQVLKVATFIIILLRLITLRRICCVSSQFMVHQSLDTCILL